MIGTAQFQERLPEESRSLTKSLATLPFLCRKTETKLFECL